MANPLWKVVIQRPMVIASLVILTISYMNVRMYNNLQAEEKQKWENKACLYLNAALIVFCVSLIACNFLSSKKECTFVDLISMPFKNTDKKQQFPNSPVASPSQPNVGLSGGNRGRLSPTRLSPRRFVY